jgi:hypothetical protein
LNPEVTDFIANVKVDWQQGICGQLRDIVHQSIPDAVERIQYGKPHFLKNGKYACVLGTAKGWVSFTIFNATEIDGPDGFFEDGPPERKTVKFKQGQAVDVAVLGEMIKQAASGL